MNKLKKIYVLTALLASTSVLCGMTEAKKNGKASTDKGKKLHVGDIVLEISAVMRYSWDFVHHNQQQNLKIPI